MTINGHDIAEYGANLLLEYTISGTAIANTYYKGKNRSTYIHYANDVGLKSIHMPIVFYGNSMAEISLRKSKLDAELLGKSELFMPDGYYYTVMLEDAGELAWKSENIAECSYTVTGCQHGELIEISGNPVNCLSTIPATDCILQTTVDKAWEEYHLHNVIFHDVHAGDILTVDGIAKRILINGGQAAHKCEFFNFPFLSPGNNVFEAPNEIVVQYYPIYL